MPWLTISRACWRAASVTVSPPSIRAISSTRSGPRASPTSVSVRPRSTRLRTAQWASASDGDLGQVGDAQDLVGAGDRLELAPHDLGHAAADARVHLVEDQGLARRVRAGHRLQGEHDPAQLAAGGDARQRPKLLAGVGRDAGTRPSPGRSRSRCPVASAVRAAALGAKRTSKRVCSMASWPSSAATRFSRSRAAAARAASRARPPPRGTRGPRLVASAASARSRSSGSPRSSRLRARHSLAEGDHLLDASPRTCASGARSGPGAPRSRRVGRGSRYAAPGSRAGRRPGPRAGPGPRPGPRDAAAKAGSIAASSSTRRRPGRGARRTAASSS